MNQDIYRLSLLREFMAARGLEAKKSLGQNFLFHKRECRKIVDSSGIESCDAVLEIGPGLGHLSGVIEEAGARVWAVEIDQRLASLWPELHPDFKGKLLEGDILKVEIPKEPSKVIGNLPYYIAGDIIARLLDCGKKWRSLTFTLQEEEVKRLVQTKGQPRYGVLNVLLQILGPTACRGRIAPDNFYPRPHIASAILHCGPIKWPEEKVWQNCLALTRAAFSQKRKMLKTNLSSFEIPPEVWQAAGVLPSMRAEELEPGQYLALASLLV